MAPARNLAVVRDNGKVRIQTLDMGALLKELTAFGSFADSVVLSADSGSIALARAAEAGLAPTLAIWQVGTASPRIVRMGLPGNFRIRDFAAGTDEALATTDAGELVRFSPATGGELARFSVRGFKTVTHARLSPDGRRLVVLGNDANDLSVAALVDAQDGAIRVAFEGRDKAGRAAAATRDDQNWILLPQQRSTVTASSLRSVAGTERRKSGI